MDSINMNIGSLIGFFIVISMALSVQIKFGSVESLAIQLASSL
jgi:hypothetical protein